jgi:hypothetical protein
MPMPLRQPHLNLLDGLYIYSVLVFVDQIEDLSGQSPFAVDKPPR